MKPATFLINTIDFIYFGTPSDYIKQFCGTFLIYFIESSIDLLLKYSFPNFKNLNYKAK